MQTVSFTPGAVLAILSLFLWQLLRGRFTKSPLDNIPGPPPESFIKGNYTQLYNRQGWGFHRKLWAKYGYIVKLHVPFGTPCLYISDPKSLRHLLADQNAVEQSPFIVESYRLLLGPGLMSALGEHHRRQRKMLNPVFSNKNLRDMLPIFYKVIYRLRQAISVQVVDGKKEIDILHWISRGALELIGQAGLGYSFDPLLTESTNDYARALKSLFPALSRLGFVRQLTPMLVKVGSPGFRRRVLDWLPSKSVRAVVEIVDTMDRTSREILEAHKRDLARTAGEHAFVDVEGGKDLMSCLLRANMKANSVDRLSDEEILGQMSSFVLAASDSTSSVLVQILQYLAQYPGIQEQLRQEIVETRKGKDLSYDEFMQMPYLDAVVKETLRLNPPATVVSRQTQKDMVVPLTSPIKGVDGKVMSDMFIPKDTLFFIGILALNVDESLWGSDASQWKPERWLNGLPDTLVDAHVPGVSSSIMTFVGGIRTCIGFKMAELELKVMLSVLLEAFKFAPSDQPIIWNIATVRFPTVGEEGVKPQLPIIVSAAEKPFQL